MKAETPFIMLPYKLLTSVAWRKLNSNSKDIYTQMKMELDKTNITFTYEKAKRVCGLSTATFRKVINQLSEFGFIDIVSSRKFNKPNIYALSERWRSYGKDEFLCVVESRGNNDFS